MLVEKVHLVFKTHVDVGFTDFAAKVLERYRAVYLPAALGTAAKLRAEGGAERLIWTLPSWIIWNALEEGDATLKSAVERGVADGDLTWHALPFTFHSELLDASLFRHSLTIAGRLDQRFGRKTIAAKMTDVPGHTRGIVPILAEAGIELLHIGVNEATPMPAVPPAFRWRVADTEIAVVYERGYGGNFSLPGFIEALAFAHTHDNRGPQDAAGVRAAFQAARVAFPAATPVASTLDDFALALRTVREALPLVEAEIGDSWIHGVASDPVKLAGFRAATRLRSHWIESAPDDPELTSFSDALLLLPEHTWGMDHKAYLDDWAAYAGDAFIAIRQWPKFQMMEASWQEQRDYLTAATAMLSGTRRQELQAELDALIAPPEPFYGRGIGAVIDTGRFRLRIAPTGSLVELLDQESGQLWSGGHDFIRLWREGFGADDYERHWKTYNVNTDRPDIAWWASYDFRKPGLEQTRRAHCTWDFDLQDLAWKRTPEAGQLCVALHSADAAVAEGAPRRAELRYTFRDQEPGFALEVHWSGKPATRLPEATWLSFAPAVAHPDRWTIDKLGQRLSPGDVVRRGGTTLHAVGDGARYDAADGRVQFRTLDAPLIAPGQPRLLDYQETAGGMSGGLHVNLHNNVWGTNFPAWFEGGARFRFHVVLEPGVQRI